MNEAPGPWPHDGLSVALLRSETDPSVAPVTPTPVPVCIEPLHTAVSGRARLAIEGLRGSPELQHRLERGLTIAPGVHGATASSLTGNVTVQYDPALPLERVTDFMTALLRGEVALPDDTARDESAQPWHTWALERLTAFLNTSPEGGLAEAAARERLATDGPNALPCLASRSDWSIFVDQFQSLPVALLAGAAVLSLATGGVLEVAAIASVVGLNAVIGYRTESRAERTIASLSLPSPQTVRVVRDGTQHEIAATMLVPGDVVLLRRGMVVPADGRLVSARGLTINEATLTGESLPVIKSCETLAAGLPLAARINMVYRGTVVTGGSGSAIVTETGGRTEVGRIQRLVGATLAPETPLQRQLDGLGRQLVWATLAAGGALFGIGWLRGFALLQMARSSLSVTVAAVPEGLPMVATTTLALGVEEMRRHGILVRRLDAIETLASVSMVCFDKTGTLTLNRMSVATVAAGERLYRARDGAFVDPDGTAITAEADPRIRTLLAIACLCSETVIDEQEGRPALTGSATENALVQVALDSGVDARALRREFPRLSVQHRSEAYRFMATTHARGGGILIAVKGSPSEVLARCRWEGLPDGGRRDLTAARRAEIEGLNARMADQALRVLGFASRDIGTADPGHAEAAIEDLTWAGLVGMADPVRPGLRELMQTLHRAGLRTVMVTGDQGATARAVADQIGLNGPGEIRILDAADLEHLSGPDLAAAAREAHAFTRMSPAQKLRIVQTLQESGVVVAMVGDGVNDSPALRAADIGIALRQDGAAAAREVADIFLDTDDLNTLTLALARSRTIHTNIRKAIHYLLGTNASEILLMLAATGLGAQAALTPLELLWINLISDVLPGIGLALDPPEAGVLEQPPRPANEAIVRPEDVGPLTRHAALLTGGAFAAGAVGVLRYGLDSPQARTMTFASLVTAQLLHALTCRSTTQSLFGANRPPPNPTLSKILVGSALAQSATLLVPGIRNLLGLAPIGAADMAVTLAGGVLPFVAAETLKPREEAPGSGILLYFSRPAGTPGA